MNQQPKPRIIVCTAMGRPKMKNRPRRMQPDQGDENEEDEVVVPLVVSEVQGPDDEFQYGPV